MTGHKIGPNPWISLAARIIEQAQDDCKGIGHINSLDSSILKALIQYDAERWLRFHPWCQFLLDCSLPMEYDVHQNDVALLTKKQRRVSYSKHLPHVDMTEQLPVTELSAVIGARVELIRNAIRENRLQGEEQVGPYGKMTLYSSLADVAIALSSGSIVLSPKRKRPYEEPPSPGRREEENRELVYSSPSGLSQ